MCDISAHEADHILGKILGNHQCRVVFPTVHTVRRFFQRIREYPAYRLVFFQPGKYIITNVHRNSRDFCSLILGNDRDL